MSSDTFSVEVLSISGDTAELLCTTSTAGGINDYAATRSFALMAIADGMGYGANTPLQQGIAAAGGRVWEQKFHEENVGRFIAETRLLERIGVVRDEGAWQRGRWADREQPDEDNFPLHRFKLRVRVTDPKYLEGLKKRSRWGTTAYDAWWNDPTRQSRSALDRVKTSYWTPKPRESERSGAKKTAKTAVKQSADEVGAKKTARKAAAKKAAVKTTAGKAAAKSGAKKAAVKTTAAAKSGAKKAAGRAAAKSGAKKAAVKTPAKKTAAKSGAKRAAVKTTAKKTAAKSGAKRAAGRAAAKSGAKKAAVKKTAKRAAAKSGAKKAAVKKTAKKTAANAAKRG
ncbi:MAG: hypothetical protein JNL82_40470 [Myxococcales bacterium]|nr:hypothetical protein [Myxococcales bacterium]